MQYADTEASDGCRLAFQTSLPLNNPAFSDPRYNTLILLIHGFSGSSDYFQRNVAALSTTAWVVAVDLRGHGESGRTRGGYHVARLAADLHEVITFLRSSVSGRGAGPQTPLRIIPVGCSIGAAILWTYVELFGDGDFASAVFVDQAPLQDRSAFDAWDATRAHRGCFDEASMLAAQHAWTATPEDAYRGLVADCLGYRFAPRAESDDLSPARAAADEAFFTAVSRRCDPVWLARLLADHTRYDHREACELLRVPVLVMAGRRTGCFPLAGMRETVERVQKGRRDRDEDTDDGAARWLEFDSGHWLFWEEPERFNRELLSFVEESAKRA